LIPGGNENSARCFHDGAVSFLHVLRHLDLVVAPLPVEPEYRDTPPVDDVRVNLAIAVLVRDHFAASGESNVCAVLLLELTLQTNAVAFKLIAQTFVIANARHPPPAAKLGVIAAEKFIF